MSKDIDPLPETKKKEKKKKQNKTRFFRDVSQDFFLMRCP